MSNKENTLRKLIRLIGNNSLHSSNEIKIFIATAKSFHWTVTMKFKNNLKRTIKMGDY